jgi:hypothetical protein
VTPSRPQTDTAPPEAIATLEAGTIAAPSSVRFGGLDVFRFLAVISMVQGHTFTVVFDAGADPPAWLRWHSYVHGYTAPMFLFASGLAFGITTFPRLSEHTADALARSAAPWRSEPARRFARYAIILAIGYLLQFPGHSLALLGAATPAGEPSVFRVDALHAIGVTLMVAQAMALVCTSTRAMAIAALGALVACVGLAPAFATASIDASVPDLVASYFTVDRGSLFPLFPFAGYVFAGIVVAYAIHASAKKRSHDSAVPALVAAGALLAIGTFLAYRASGALDLHPVLSGGHAVFWRASPLLFFFRVGLLLVLLGTVSTLAGARRPAPVVRAAAQETLVVYVLHLLVLYGSPIHRGLELDVGKHLDLARSTGVAALLIGAMLAAAYGWHWVKTKKPLVHDAIRWAIAAVVMVHSLAPL